jgi:formylglycine-generating enzyme required for sulfatase activity
VYDNPLDPGYTLKPPKNLTVTAITSTSATLQWKEENSYRQYPNVKVQYEIEQSIDNTNNFSLVKTIDANTTKTTINSAFNLTKDYYFRIRAKVNTKTSAFSNTVAANILGLVMKFVQGGTFQMGSNSGNSDEQPIHSVTVRKM